MRAAIYGAGAMGSALGAFISRAGADVELISRNAGHITAMKRNGVRVLCGGEEFTVPVKALLPDEMTGVYDVVILMTKQRDNARIAEYIVPFLSGCGVICTAQNGLPEDSVAEIAGRERTLGCVVSWGAELIADGTVKLTSSPDKLTFTTGSAYGENPAAYAVAALLSLMGRVSVEKNFLGARWAKLAVNSAFSPLSALSGRTFGELSADKRTRALVQLLLKEAFDASEAAGVKMGAIQGHDIKKLLDYRGSLRKKISFALIPLAMKKHGAIVSGMYRDLAAGRPCDVDFLNGKVLEAAVRGGISAPVNRAVIELIHSAEAGETALGAENLNKLCKQFL